MRPWIILAVFWLGATVYTIVDGRYEDAGLSLLLMVGCGVALYLEHKEARASTAATEEIHLIAENYVTHKHAKV